MRTTGRRYEARGHRTSAEQLVCHYVPDGSAAGLAAGYDFFLAEQDYAKADTGYERIMVHFVVRRGVDCLSLLLPNLCLELHGGEGGRSYATPATSGG